MSQYFFAGSRLGGAAGVWSVGEDRMSTYLRDECIRLTSDHVFMRDVEFQIPFDRLIHTFFLLNLSLAIFVSVIAGIRRRLTAFQNPILRQRGVGAPALPVLEVETPFVR
jgi:hypothetical protein